jgi:hypothetical protein
MVSSLLSSLLVLHETFANYTQRFLGETIPTPEHAPYLYSCDFQWLPCEVSVDDRGNAKITSYINNLHPSGREELYSAIEEVITQAIPLWIDSLVSTLVLPNGDRMEGVGDGYVAHREDFETSDSDKEANEWDSETEDSDEGVDEWDSETEENYVLPEPKGYGQRARVGLLSTHHSTQNHSEAFCRALQPA